MEERSLRALAADGKGHDLRADSRRFAVLALTKGDYDVFFDLGRRWGFSAFADACSTYCRPVLFLSAKGRGLSYEIQPCHMLTRGKMTLATLPLRIRYVAMSIAEGISRGEGTRMQPIFNTT